MDMAVRHLALDSEICAKSEAKQEHPGTLTCLGVGRLNEIGIGSAENSD